MPNHLWSKNREEEVLLSCETDDSVDANPRCSRYVWDHKNDNNNNSDDDYHFIVSNKSRDSGLLKFFMDEKFEGKYRCKCLNDFGESEYSNVTAVWLSNTTSTSEFISIFRVFQ